MGGCGKSQLALEYCRQGQNEKWFSAILWLDANSPMSIAQSFTNIANKLSKPNFDIADDKGNIRFVLDTIEAWKFRWLLVFDNFDDPSSFSNTNIKEYFPRGRYGSILFTSRHTEAKSLGQGFYIEVTTMSNEEALQLLLERSQAEKTSTNLQEGADIVKRLGYHALAIDQAGAYILARGLDLKLYMTHYTERKEKVLNEVPKLWDYKRKLKTDTEVETKLSVFTTWELSIQLISGSPDARKDKVHLLTLAGFLDGNEVSDELFRCYSSRNIDWLVPCLRDGVWDKYEAQDILKEFQNLSLLQNLHIGKDETIFSLHPLIQDWVKLRVDSNARRAYTREAILVLSAFLEFQSVDNMKLKTKQTLLSHLEAVLQNENDYTVLRDNLEETELLDATFEFGAFFRAHGRYDLSQQMYQHTLKGMTKVLGKEHPDTLRSMNNLAYLFNSQGKYDTAEPLYRETLQLTEKILGKEHPDTLRSMNNLAGLFDSQGNYDAAEPLYRETLQLRKKILGKEHPDTLTSMNNLAYLFNSQGKYDAAEPLYRETLQLRKKILGKEHPDTLTSMNNLAGLFDSQGNYDAAEPLYRETLQLIEKILGKEHPNTLKSMNNLADLFESQGKYDIAEPLYREILQLREKILGKEHPDTLRSMNNLAYLFDSQGKYDAAEPLYRETLQLTEKILGKEHPNTLISMRNLVRLLKSQGKYDAAELLYRETRS
jgi:Flp pilus assembly protein TadD